MKIKDILQYRVWYKPDEKTKDGFLEFEVIEDKEIGVCIQMKKDKEVRYPIDCIFTDDDWIIDRPTGLKDCKGITVYENDILGYKGDHDIKRFVKWSKRHLTWICTYKVPAGELFEDFWCMGVEGMNYEIIGNLYLNPELLTK